MTLPQFRMWSTAGRIPRAVGRREEVAGIVAAMAPGQRVGLVAALRAFTEAGGEPSLDDRAVRDAATLGWE